MVERKDEAGNVVQWDKTQGPRLTGYPLSYMAKEEEEFKRLTEVMQATEPNAKQEDEDAKTGMA